jgi:hypothetical protein
LGLLLPRLGSGAASAFSFAVVAPCRSELEVGEDQLHIRPKPPPPQGTRTVAAALGLEPLASRGGGEKPLLLRARQRHALCAGRTGVMGGPVKERSLSFRGVPTVRARVTKHQVQKSRGECHVLSFRCGEARNGPWSCSVQAVRHLRHSPYRPVRPSRPKSPSGKKLSLWSRL